MLGPYTSPMLSQLGWIQHLKKIKVSYPKMTVSHNSSRPDYMIYLLLLLLLQQQQFRLYTELHSIALFLIALFFSNPVTCMVIRHVIITCSYIHVQTFPLSLPNTLPQSSSIQQLVALNMSHCKAYFYFFINLTPIFSFIFTIKSSSFLSRRAKRVTSSKVARCQRMIDKQI